MWHTEPWGCLIVQHVWDGPYTHLHETESWMAARNPSCWVNGTLLCDRVDKQLLSCNKVVVSLWRPALGGDQALS